MLHDLSTLIQQKALELTTAASNLPSALLQALAVENFLLRGERKMKSMGVGETANLHRSPRRY